MGRATTNNRPNENNDGASPFCLLGSFFVIEIFTRNITVYSLQIKELKKEELDMTQQTYNTKLP